MNIERYLSDEHYAKSNTPKALELATKLAQALATELGRLLPIAAWAHVGASRWTQAAGDVDVLVLIENPTDGYGDQRFAEAMSTLMDPDGLNFSACLLYDAMLDKKTFSFRRGLLNVLLVRTRAEFDAFVAADEVVAMLQPKEKVVRVYLHRLIRQHKSKEQALEETAQYVCAHSHLTAADARTYVANLIDRSKL